MTKNDNRPSPAVIMEKRPLLRSAEKFENQKQQKALKLFWKKTWKPLKKHETTFRKKQWKPIKHNEQPLYHFKKPWNQPKTM